MQIRITCEQEPNPESRILLSNKTDALENPTSQCTVAITNLTRDTIKVSRELLRGEFRKVGLGEIILDSWLGPNNQDWMEHVNDQFHHMGTARMHYSGVWGWWTASAECMLFRTFTWGKQCGVSHQRAFQSNFNDYCPVHPAF